MKLKNSFTERSRWLFSNCYQCFICLENNWDALHHILGRVSNSPLNACPIHNLRCHIGNSRLDGFEKKAELLKATLRYLLNSKYKLSNEDEAFMKKNKKYYE